MKKTLLVYALICSLCSSLAYGENPLLSDAFWETATAEDVDSAVANGADVNAKDNMGITALMYAAWNNANPAVIERLLKLGADAAYKNRAGQTALEVAKQNKSAMGTQAYQILSDATDLAYKEKPFFSEAFWRTATAEAVDSAVANGADVNADMGSGWTALMLAARNNSPGDVIERLVKLGADVHARDTLLGRTILMHAARRSPNPEIIDLLVKLGADVNSRTEQGWTALMMARNPEVIERLVKLGADVDARDASLGRTALMLAAEGNPNPDVVECLVKLGVDINARDKYQGRTALMWAARFTSNPEVIERLLKLGADVSYKSETGQTALGLVQENKQLKGAKPKAYQMLYNAVNKTTLTLDEIKQKRILDTRIKQQPATPVPTSMVLVPAGDFVMGDTFGEGGKDELPLHTNTVSAFYMDTTETTKTKWDEVYIWATVNGYIFSNTGLGKASDHPVHTINWYDCVKWANARSEMEGRTPCYTLAGEVYRTSNSAAPTCDWQANGYRLPTEAEWEKAARGGAANHRFPWSDTNRISHSRANYYAKGGDPYDDSDDAGFHPDYDSDGTPYTSPAGSFAPNDYGLYDMAGNLYEWCWDRYGHKYYASSPSVDPRGPGPGGIRVARDGYWNRGAKTCRVAKRFSSPPGKGYGDLGFRLVRTAQ